MEIMRVACISSYSSSLEQCLLTGIFIDSGNADGQSTCGISVCIYFCLCITYTTSLTVLMVILSLPLIQEGQLSVSGEGMCTILVNRLED